MVTKTINLLRRFATPPNTEYIFSQLAVNIMWYCHLKIISVIIVFFIYHFMKKKGSEAIDWFIANGFATTRQEGIQIGQVCKLHCNINLKNSYYSRETD